MVKRLKTQVFVIGEEGGAVESGGPCRIDILHKCLFAPKSLVLSYQINDEKFLVGP